MWIEEHEGDINNYKRTITYYRPTCKVLCFHINETRIAIQQTVTREDILVRDSSSTEWYLLASWEIKPKKNI